MGNIYVTELCKTQKDNERYVHVTRDSGLPSSTLPDSVLHLKPNMQRHSRIVNKLSLQVRDFVTRGEKFRIYHGSSNSTRPPSSGTVLDVSALNKVLVVERESSSWCLVEPNVPMDKLVEATMRFGLIPPVVMEFPGITVGGGFSGTSGESSSFRYGYFSDNVLEIEMILGNG